MVWSTQAEVKSSARHEGARKRIDDTTQRAIEPFRKRRRGREADGPASVSDRFVRSPENGIGILLRGGSSEYTISAVVPSYLAAEALRHWPQSRSRTAAPMPLVSTTVAPGQRMSPVAMPSSSTRVTAFSIRDAEASRPRA